MYNGCRVDSRAAPEVERRCLATIAGAKVRYEVCPFGDADEEGLLGRPVPNIQCGTRQTSRLGLPSFSSKPAFVENASHLLFSLDISEDNLLKESFVPGRDAIIICI